MLTQQQPRQRSVNDVINDAVNQFRDYLEGIYLQEQGFGTVTAVCRPTDIQIDRNSGKRFKIDDKTIKP